MLCCLASRTISLQLKDFDAYLRCYDSLSIDSLYAAYAAESGVVRDTVKEQPEPESLLPVQNLVFHSSCLLAAS